MTKQAHQEWLDGENEPESPLEEIKRIISSNTTKNRYTKCVFLKLFRLNSLIKELK